VFRHGIRLRVDHDGKLEVVDPDPSAVDLMLALDPEFRIRTAPLEGFQGPRVLSMRARSLAITEMDLRSRSTGQLWRLHDEAAVRATGVEARWTPSEGAGISLLDLKIELARRALAACRLCGHGCGVNRLAGEMGKCGLADAAFVAECFVHVAEEPPINPSLNINLMGCALRCRFCQQFPLLQVRPGRGQLLDGRLWDRLSLEEARSLSFVGGNPDESVYAILRFLRQAPEDFALPVVWNCHGFATDVVHRLLGGIVDCYVPDFKYWNDECAVRWSGAAGYHARVTSGLLSMVQQDVPVFVRILVLPGHFECCHCPALRWLARAVGSRIKVRIMGQYHPDYLVAVGKGKMGRRPTTAEVEQVETLAGQLGLIAVDGTQIGVR
jgi:putative pyruvate formate lyase activating enzyme